MSLSGSPRECQPEALDYLTRVVRDRRSGLAGAGRHWTPLFLPGKSRKAIGMNGVFDFIVLGFYV